MERFIANDLKKELLAYQKFKIQYGEIYSLLKSSLTSLMLKFKIQYGEIYSCCCVGFTFSVSDLKSSMERFIVNFPFILPPLTFI